MTNVVLLMSSLSHGPRADERLENPTAPTAETGVDKTLEEYLTAVPDFIRWDYWQFTDDFDALREYCRHAEVKWYRAAIEHDAKLYHIISHPPTLLRGDAPSGRFTNRRVCCLAKTLI